ncbi:MAG: hypothetical protein RLZZ232_2541 [Planctomycetota bacterium]|jgi:hypothetical protein
MAEKPVYALVPLAIPRSSNHRSLFAFEIRPRGDVGVSESERTFVLADLPLPNPDPSLQLTSLPSRFASATMPEVRRTRCVCHGHDGNPVPEHAKNDQKWKPSQLHIPMRFVKCWKLLRSSCDTPKCTVNFRIELKSDLRTCRGVVPQSLCEISFSSRTNLNRFHPSSPAALRALCRTTSQSAVGIFP